MMEQLKENCPEITIYKIPTSEIEKILNNLPARNCLSLSGTIKVLDLLMKNSLLSENLAASLAIYVSIINKNF